MSGKVLSKKNTKALKMAHKHLMAMLADAGEDHDVERMHYLSGLAERLAADPSLADRAERYGRMMGRPWW